MNEMMKRRCPNCGTAMECKLQNFSIGADGGGGLMTLLADQYEVDLFACPQCGRVELYTAGYSRAPRRAPYWCEHCGKEREDRLCPECHQVCDLMEDHLCKQAKEASDQAAAWRTTCASRRRRRRPLCPRCPLSLSRRARRPGSRSRPGSASPGRSGRSPLGRDNTPGRRLNRFVTENQNFPKG